MLAGKNIVPISEVRELFGQTLIGGYESEAAWSAVLRLHRAGSREILDEAVSWCLSADPRKRVRAADVLGQLGRPAGSGEPWLLRDQSYGVIAEMLQTERDPLVLDSALTALGHLGKESAVPMILRYLDHPDHNVRFAAAFALGSFPNHPQSVSGLLKLTADADINVRDWAVFGVGVLGDTDSPEIRDALLRCIDDTNEDVREEAAVGLAKRKDRRVIPTLNAMLDAPELTGRVAEAAATLLGIERHLSEWSAADYQAALRIAFPTEP